MYIRHSYIILFSSVLIFQTACKQPYEPPAVKNNPGFLVVEGFITGSPDSTNITLTHTRNIADSTPGPPELNASVLVETETGHGNA